MFEHWCADMNSVELSICKKSDPRQFYFYKPCRKHFTVRTIQSMEQNPAGIHCGACNNVHESEGERTLCKFFDKPDSNVMFLLGDKLLKGRFGAVDFYLVPYKLAVEYDGQGHFTKPYHNTSIQEQNDRDRRKDAEYWSQGHNLVRVHYADVACYAGAIALAFSLYRQDKQQQFHVYSLAYGKPIRRRPRPTNCTLAWTEVHM